MIIEMIQEWFKELLIDGIISNLSGTFDTERIQEFWKQNTAKNTCKIVSDNNKKCI